MFFLIGGDGREYGPFTVEQIRDWVAQGRANAHSRIRRDGETTWQPLKDFAEFADVSSLVGGAAARHAAAAAVARIDRRRLPGARRAGGHRAAASPADGRSSATTPA